MASEWTKLRSVRSTKSTMAAFIVVTVAVGAVVSAVAGPHWTHLSAADRANFDPVNVSLAGLAFGELAIGVLGVLAMTGEYSSGTIRSTLAATPNRPLVLAAKATVFAAVALVVGEAVTVATFLAGQALMGPAPHAALTQPSVLRAVALSGAFLPLIGLFGLGLGAIIRHSAGAIAAFAAVVLVLPIALQAFPGHLTKFTPEGMLSSSIAAVRP